MLRTSQNIIDSSSSRLGDVETRTPCSNGTYSPLSEVNGDYKNQEALDNLINPAELYLDVAEYCDKNMNHPDDLLEEEQKIYWDFQKKYDIEFEVFLKGEKQGDGYNSMLYSGDCIKGALDKIKADTVDLIICDPPFGIDEKSFGKHYNRDESKVISGYVEAPADYYEFSLGWITQAKRILKKDGAMYIVSGWSNLRHILNVVHELELNLVNHLVWKFSFGVSTRKKFVTDHYCILYITKSKKSKPTFNTFCRYAQTEKNENNRSLLYKDMEAVWNIKKEYKSGKNKDIAFKNINKLPEALIKKMIQYSSNEGDLVCDFFMGGFTTAYVSKKMGRRVCGFEMNNRAYNYFVPKLNEIKYGADINEVICCEEISACEYWEKVRNHPHDLSAEEQKIYWKFCDKYSAEHMAWVLSNAQFLEKAV